MASSIHERRMAHPFTYHSTQADLQHARSFLNSPSVAHRNFLLDHKNRQQQRLMFINATVAEESKRRRKHEEAKQNRRSQSFRSSNDGDGARSLNDNSIEDEYDQEDEIAIYNRNDSPFSDIRSMQPVSQSDKSMSLLCDYKDFCSLYVVDNNTFGSGFAPFSGELSSAAHHRPIWLTSAGLTAVSKMNALRNRGTADVIQYKVAALRYLREAISQPEENNDDVTILSLIAFLSAEVLNAYGPGDHVAIWQHFRGIEALIKLRGGPKELRKYEIGRMVLACLYIYYLTYAVMYDQPAAAAVDGPPQLQQNLQSFLDEPHCCASPLVKFIVEEEEYTSFGSPELQQTLQCIMPFLGALSAAMNTLFEEFHEEPDSFERLVAATYRSRLVMPPEPFVFEESPYEVSTTFGVRHHTELKKIARSCYLAGCIFFRAVTTLTPFTDPINMSDVDELATLMKTVDRSSWNLTPWVWLWVAIVGLSASTEHAHRAFFGVQLSRASILFGARWWSTYRQHILNFLWLQRIIRSNDSKTLEAKVITLPII